MSMLSAFSAVRHAFTKGDEREELMVSPTQPQGTSTSRVISAQNPQVAAIRVLICLLEDDHVVFQVKVPTDNNVLDLKKLVQKERKDSVFRNIDPYVLLLWKVRHIRNPALTMRLTISW